MDGRMDEAEVRLSTVMRASIAHKTCAGFLLKCVNGRVEMKENSLQRDGTWQ